MRNKFFLKYNYVYVFKLYDYNSVRVKNLITKTNYNMFHLYNL